MEGIVKNLGNGIVIEFSDDPGVFKLYGKELSSRRYNKGWICSANKIKDSLGLGHVIKVENGFGSITNNIGTSEVIDMPSNDSSILIDINNNLLEIIKYTKKTYELFDKRFNGKEEKVVEQKPKAAPHERVIATPAEEYKDKCWQLRELYRCAPDEINYYANMYLPRVRELEKELGIEKAFDYAK